MVKKHGFAHFLLNAKNYFDNRGVGLSKRMVTSRPFFICVQPCLNFNEYLKSNRHLYLSLYDLIYNLRV